MHKKNRPYVLLALRTSFLGVLFCANFAHAQDFSDPTVDMPGAIVRRPPRQEPARNPPPAPGKACALELSLRSQQQDRTVALTAEVTNRQAGPISFKLASTCTFGPARFSGISAQRDFYGGCNRGACVIDEPISVTLQPQERRKIATVDVHLDGDPCNPPVAVGSHEVTYSLNFRSPPLTVCGPRPLAFVHQAPRRPSAPVVGPRCPPMLPCGIYCPHGMKKNAQGCGQCACADSPLQPPRVEPMPFVSPPPPPPRHPPAMIASASADLPGVYQGVHPHWSDQVILAPDGTYRRATGDAGRWTFDGRTLVLGWYNWGPEYLEVRGPGHFVARKNGFTLRRLQ